MAVAFLGGHSSPLQRYHPPDPEDAGALSLGLVIGERRSSALAGAGCCCSWSSIDRTAAWHTALGLLSWVGATLTLHHGSRFAGRLLLLAGVEPQMCFHAGTPRGGRLLNRCRHVGPREGRIHLKGASRMGRGAAWGRLPRRSPGAWVNATQGWITQNEARSSDHAPFWEGEHSTPLPTKATPVHPARTPG